MYTLTFLYLITFLIKLIRGQDEFYACSNLIEKDLAELKKFYINGNLIKIKFKERVVVFEIPIISKNEEGLKSLWYKMPSEFTDSVVLNNGNLQFPGQVVVKDQSTYIFKEDDVDNCKLQLLDFKETESQVIKCDKLTFWCRLIPIGHLNIYFYEPNSNLLFKYFKNLFQVFNLTDFSYNSLYIKKLAYEVKDAAILSTSTLAAYKPSEKEFIYNLIELDNEFNLHFIYFEKLKGQNAFRFTDQFKISIREFLPCSKIPFVKELFFNPTEVKAILFQANFCFIFFKFHYLTIKKFKYPFFIQKEHLSEMRLIDEKLSTNWRMELSDRKWIFEIKYSEEKLLITYDQLLKPKYLNNELIYTPFHNKLLLTFSEKCSEQIFALFLLEKSGKFFFCFQKKTYYFLGRTSNDMKTLEENADSSKKFQLKNIFYKKTDPKFNNFSEMLDGFLETDPDLILIFNRLPFTVFMFSNVLIYIKDLSLDFEKHSNELIPIGKNLNNEALYVSNHCLFISCLQDIKNNHLL